MQSWDAGYYAEKLREARYSVSQEALRAYFPVDKVLSGLFAIVERLYGIQIRELHDFERWHADVRLFEILENGEHVGRFFDLYARANKRGGAWMDGARDRRRDAQGRLIDPVAYLVCNFTPAVNGKPALLTHDEVTTLFHEFGHGLHHLLTRVEHAAASGINGWPGTPSSAQPVHGELVLGAGRPGADLRPLRDRRGAAAGPAGEDAGGEELPVRDDDGPPAGVLPLRLRRHPRRRPQRAAGARGHPRRSGGDASAGVQPLRQQLRAHLRRRLRGRLLQHKWAEVLSADAFSRFEEEGVFNPDTGRAFREAILARGGSREPMLLFVDFRGREPSIDALLRHSGLVGEAA